MGEVVHVQSASRYVRCHEQLGEVLTELLHGKVSLLLRQVAVQSLCVIAFLYQFVSYLLCLYLCATEDDAIDARIVVHYALQGKILVLGVHHIIDVVDVLSTLIARTHHYLLIVVQVFLRHFLHLLAHGGREEERLVFLRQSLENGVDAIRETHVEHLVSLVEHYVAHLVQMHLATLHQVYQSAWCSNDYLCSMPERAYLVANARATIYGNNVDAFEVFGEIAQVVGYLQAQLAGRGEHYRLSGTVLCIHHL